MPHASSAQSASGAVLLLGAPGSGKSALGKLLKEVHSRHVLDLVNVGEQLRATGEVAAHLRNPTLRAKHQLSQAADAILNSACERFVARPTTDRPQVLLLECVKEIEDAYKLQELLSKHGIQLQQVLYVSGGSCTSQLLKQSVSTLITAQLPTGSGHRTDAGDKQTEERQAKWQRNQAQLIEYYSAQGLLAEVAAWEEPEPATAPASQATANKADSAATPSSSSSNNGGGEGSSTHVAAAGTPLQAPAGTLAALGYTAVSSPGSLWLARVGWCDSSTGGLHAVNAFRPRPQHRYGYGRVEQQRFLTVTHIEPVVSPRLVISAAEKHRVLAFAARSTGLFGSTAADSAGSDDDSASSTSSSKFHSIIPVPLQSVATEASAYWVGVPGRYSVSHKCDGTRYLLVASGEKGHCHLIDRCGKVYRYPYKPLGGTTSTATGSSSSSSGNNSISGDSTVSSTSSQDADKGAEPGSSLPAGTVLDGELVWLPRGGAGIKQGLFLVFDALSIGSRRVWQLPLWDRLEAMQHVLQLPAANYTSVLPQAAAAAAATAAAASVAVAASSSNNGDSGDSSSGSSDSPTGAHSSTSSSHRGTKQPLITIEASPDTSRLGLRRGQVQLKVSVNLRVAKKQQAPLESDDNLTLLFKPHYHVSADQLQQLQQEVQSGRVPFPTDGLVFTPAAMPYVSGLQELLIEWQPWQQTGVDVLGSNMLQGRQLMSDAVNFMRTSLGLALTGQAATSAASKLHSCLQELPAGLVYECVAMTAADLHKCGPSAADITRSSILLSVGKPAGPLWMPQSVRWDKAKGNSSALLKQLEQRLQHPSVSCMDHEQLVQAIRQVQQYIGSTGAGHSSSSSQTGLKAMAGHKHPAKSQPFDELYAAVQEAVAAGLVERSIDQASGLEVYCYTMARGAPSSLIAAMCRGLVLHPGSKTVVATPFVRFDNLKPDQVGLHILDAPPAPDPDSSSWLSSATTASSTQGTHSGLPSSSSSPTQQSDLGLAKKYRAVFDHQPMYQEWCSQAPGSASFKLDGSLIIAFMWRGQLHTCTRRRMDSEQAIWGRTWLQQHLPAGTLQDGWTYMFEAIYAGNTHVIQYPFEGLVLLEAIDPTGAALPTPAARQQLARQLMVMAAPSIEGTIPELTLRLAAGCKALPDEEPAAASAKTTSSTSSSRRISLAEFAAKKSSSSNNRNNPSSSSSTPATFEGWVLQDHSTGQRHKLVQQSFRQTGYIASTRLHPLVVWDCIHKGMTRSQMLQGLPSHYQDELVLIATPLEQQFKAVQQRLDADLQQAWYDRAQCFGSSEQAIDASVSAIGTSSKLHAAVLSTASGAAGACSVASDSTCETAAVAPAGPLDEHGVTQGETYSSIDSSSSSSSGGGGSSMGFTLTTAAGAVFRVCPQAYAEALTYALQKGTAKVGYEMCKWDKDPKPYVWSAAPGATIPTADRGELTPVLAPSLRGLLLDCIRPSTDGTLAGYTPSPAFKQTYCKGWAKGPVRGRVSVLDLQPATARLNDEALMAVLACRHDSREVGRALLVCRAWCRLLQGDAGFQQKARQATVSRPNRPAARSSSYDRDEYSDYGGYSSDDHDYTYDGGYGSA